MNILLFLRETLSVATRSGSIDVESGQAVIVQAGEWVQYSSPKGAEYLAICVPAFSPEIVHREGSDKDQASSRIDKIDITYKEFGKDGLPLIEELWNHLRTYHVCNARYFRDQLLARPFSERCNDIVQTNATREILVHLAQVNSTGPYIGFCVSSASPGAYGEIESIFVLPEYRSLGIGTEFMKKCTYLVQKNGCE